MFYDDARPYSSDSDTPESGIRFAMVLAEFWHDWFEAMSEVAYQTHRACEFFVQNGGSLKGQYGPFDFRESFDLRSSRNEYGGPSGSIDMDKLKECLQSMDSIQAARVMHAVQMMQAMEAMLKRRRSRTNQAERLGREMATRRYGRVVMSRHWLTERLQSWGDRPALIWSHESWSFSQLCDDCDAWLARLAQQGVKPGDSLAICGDYSPKLCASLLAALLNRNIIIPLASATAPRWNRLMELAQVQFAVRFDGDDSWHVTGFDRVVTHPLVWGLRGRDAPGLILFSSGSTGESKASVLDLNRLLAKFEVPRPAYRTLVFLLLDHIGGINTLLHGLCHGGTIITTRERSPE